MDSYLVPSAYGEAELVEKRSRFIGQLWRVRRSAGASTTPATTAGAMSSGRGISSATATTASPRAPPDSPC